MKLRTCVTPSGFVVGVHDPAYNVANLREQDHINPLGLDEQDRSVDNRDNFPGGDVHVPSAARIYEIPNAFPFRGTTYIDSSWADAKACDLASIRLPAPAGCSLSHWLKTVANVHGLDDQATARQLFAGLPEPMLTALAAVSTDPEDLRVLAFLSCDIIVDPGTGEPLGLRFAVDTQGRIRPVIHRHDLFETLMNNPCLPDSFKQALVLRPGTQGGSEIVGDAGGPGGQTHVFEYLRRNSYIPWGHYAANMADDAVRYAIRDLSAQDMRSLRHLYYQRTFVRLAEELGLEGPRRRRLSTDALERLRLEVLAAVGRVRAEGRQMSLSGTLWGWNFGFDFAPSGYRLHASHQQVHQQYALIPGAVAKAGQPGAEDSIMPAFACGDLVAEVVQGYRAETGHGFFDDYEQALRSNTRTDGGPGESSLIVYEDDRVVLFVPKGQTSGWELQLMPVRPVGNILEADRACRDSLDQAMLVAQQVLEGLGARLVTSIEYSRRFDSRDTDQRLLYAFLPKLPYAPGGFSEAQLRFIVGHYPEDFAATCRRQIAKGRGRMAEP